ncbi:hypothetical protein D9M71_656310 [compost metagenome]
MAGDHVAVHALGFFTEPLQEGGGIGDFATGFAQWLALFQGHQARQVFLVGHHQVEPLAQLDGAVLGGQGAPGRQGAVGGFDGAAGLGGAHFRHATDDLAGGRVVDLEGLAVVGIHPGTVDIGLLAEQLRIVELHAKFLLI